MTTRDTDYDTPRPRTPTHEQDLEMLEGLCEGWQDVLRWGNRPFVDSYDLRLIRRIIERSRRQRVPVATSKHHGQEPSDD